MLPCYIILSIKCRRVLRWTPRILAMLLMYSNFKDKHFLVENKDLMI